MAMALSALLASAVAQAASLLRGRRLNLAGRLAKSSQRVAEWKKEACAKVSSGDELDGQGLLWNNQREGGDGGGGVE